MIMPMHSDFKKIYKRFIVQYGQEEGKTRYFAWLNKKGYDDTRAFSQKKETKELKCLVHGVEIKEEEKCFHVSGLIATDHIDELDKSEDIDIPDVVTLETLHAWADQVNTDSHAQEMGVHHSEGKPINAEYFGRADIQDNPAEVIDLNDGHHGLYVDTKLLKYDAKTPEIIKQFETEELNSFSVTYNTNGFLTTDFDWVDDKLVRFIGPETRLCGYTAASNPVNPHAIATGYGFKEFKELVGKGSKENTEVIKMGNETKEETETEEKPKEEPKKDEKVEEKPSEKPAEDVGSEEKDDAEKKELEEFRKQKRDTEEKELRTETAKNIAEMVVEKMEVKEKVLKDTEKPGEGKPEMPMEVKEFRELINPECNVEIKEQFRRAAVACDSVELDWQTATTSKVESREYKEFRCNGRNLEYKGLGLTTNQNDDTDYLQSSAELQDYYDPIIYNALNQATLTWNILPKEDYSKKGNNKVQFTLKTAANASAAFYTGNAVTTDNVTRLKFETKFKKVQVGVSVDGDMIAAARGGPVSDLFAQEVLDSTMDMLAVVNAALFGETGLETATNCIGFEYLADSAGNTTLYNLTRSTTNKLAPDAAGDTYIDQSSGTVSLTNMRAAVTQAMNEGANKRNLVWITNPTQGNMLRGKFDAARRHLSSKDTSFGFATDLYVDEVPVFEDKDCNSDDWWLVDMETHRIAIWVPPTIEKLGKTADSEDAFIKMYFAAYNRAPRRMVQIYGCATS